MHKFSFIIAILFTCSTASAQFIDVEKINKPKESRSLMFQDNNVSENASKVEVTEKKVKQNSAPKKNSKVNNITFFKPGDAKIMAIVNGEAISSSDVENAAKLFMLNTGVPLNNKTKPMIINKVLQSIIDEKIKYQEIEKSQIKLSDKDLNKAFDSYEKSRNLAKGGLTKLFKQKGINPEVFKQQLKTEILWARLIRQKMAFDSNVTQREVEDAIARSKEDMKSPKYMVSEIVIPVSKAKNIEVLVDNIRRDGLFNMYAAQFSSAPSSSNGGSLGWVKEGQLAKPLEDKIKKMRVGQVSEPLKHNGNYYILRLDNKFSPKGKPQEISYDDMRDVLVTERLEGYASKYMQNLRQKSVIEFKG